MIITDINGKQRECVKAYPDKDYPGFVKVEFKNERRSYNEWYPIDEFLAKNPDFSDSTKEIKHEAPEITGVVTSATDTTLTDKTPSSIIQSFIRKYLVFELNRDFNLTN